MVFPDLFSLGKYWWPDSTNFRENRNGARMEENDEGEADDDVGEESTR
jgi:hypothetical protein